MTSEQQAALRLAVECVLEAAQVAGPLGAPSGVVYAAMSAHGMRLATYQSLLDAMQRAGKIEVVNHCIFVK